VKAHRDCLSLLRSCVYAQSPSLRPFLSYAAALPKPSIAAPDPDLICRLDLNCAASRRTRLHPLTVAHPGFHHGACPLTLLWHSRAVPLPGRPPPGRSCCHPQLDDSSQTAAAKVCSKVCSGPMSQIHFKCTAFKVTDDRGKRCRWVGNSVIQTFRNKAEISFLSADIYFNQNRGSAGGSKRMRG